MESNTHTEKMEAWESEATERHARECSARSFTKASVRADGKLTVWIRCDDCGKRFAPVETE